MASYKVALITIMTAVITTCHRIENECLPTDDVEWNVWFNDEDSDLSKNKYCYNICLYSASQCDFSEFIEEWNLFVPDCCNNNKDDDDIEIICDAMIHESCRKKTKYNTDEYGWKWSNFRVDNDEGCCQFCVDYSNDNEYNIIPYINGNYSIKDKYGSKYKGNTIVPDICGCTQTDDSITAEPTPKTPCPTIDPLKSENANIAKISISTGIMKGIININNRMIDNYIAYLLNDEFNDKLISYDVTNIEYMTKKYAAYVATDELIKSRNSMGLSYKLQHTFMSDLLDYEIQEFLGGNLDILNPDDIQTSPQQPIPACYDSNSIQFNGEPPANWRNAPVHDIRDQENCGSCWNFAAVSAVEVSVHENSGAVYDLSEQMVLDCIPHCDGTSFRDTCSGGSSTRALAYIRDNAGLCTETNYRYDYEAGIKKCQSDNCNILSCTAPDAIYCLPHGKNNANDIDTIVGNIKSAVLLGGVSISFAFPPSLGSYKLDPTSSTPDIFECIEEDVNKTSGGHVMTIVGYTSDYWIIRNSWGSSVSDTGYVYWKIKDNLNEDYCNLYSRNSPRFPYFNVNKKKCQISNDGIGGFLGNDIPQEPDYSNLVLNVAPNFKCRVYLYEYSWYSNSGDIYGWYYVGQYTWTNAARITIKSISISSSVPPSSGNINNFVLNLSSYCRVFLYEFSDYSGQSITITGPAALPNLSSKGFAEFTVGAMIVV